MIFTLPAVSLSDIQRRLVGFLIGFIRMLFVAQLGKSKSGTPDVAQIGSLVQIQPDSITYEVYGAEACKLTQTEREGRMAITFGWKK